MYQASNTLRIYAISVPKLKCCNLIGVIDATVAIISAIYGLLNGAAHIYPKYAPLQSLPRVYILSGKIGMELFVVLVDGGVALRRSA